MKNFTLTAQKVVKLIAHVDQVRAALVERKIPDVMFVKVMEVTQVDICSGCLEFMFCLGESTIVVAYECGAVIE